MDDLKAQISELMDEFDESRYPSDFLADYVILECLACHNGVETFLVEARADAVHCVAKCFDKGVCAYSAAESRILRGLEHSALPRLIGEYENDLTVCVVREYIAGLPADQYAREHPMDHRAVTQVGIQLCDILTYLHRQPQPVIHRDIKPQNVIIDQSGKAWLIDFDIARMYDTNADSDTHYFGTKEYAPPEQYGFSQTDCRADIYSLGILLRYLSTGSGSEDPGLPIYPPLERVIRKCTAFSPRERFANAGEVKKCLLAANPKSQLIRKTTVCAVAIALITLCAFVGVQIYRAVTYSPFDRGLIPAYLTDEERVDDAVSYLSEKYDTNLFAETDKITNIGHVKTILTDVYGLDKDYVYAFPAEGPPHESDQNFLPWTWEDVQTVPREVMVYIAVKVYWPDVVTDWSSLKDDNGVYPGGRVALAFAEEAGILTGINRPADLTVGDIAVILANADRVYVSTTE